MRISDWSSDVCSSDLPKSDLLIQLAYFKIDRGAAYAANLPGTDTLHFYTNGREVYEGGELSITGYVTPDLAVYATATILSAHYRGQPGIAGNRVDGTPKGKIGRAHV